MRILLLSRWFPYPPDNGAKLRINHLIKGLLEQHEVYLLSFSDHPQLDAARVIQKSGFEVQVVQWQEFNPASPRALLGLFSPIPRSLVDTYSPEMERCIRLVLSEHFFHLFIISEWIMNA